MNVYETNPFSSHELDLSAGTGQAEYDLTTLDPPINESNYHSTQVMDDTASETTKLYWRVTTFNDVERDKFVTAATTMVHEPPKKISRAGTNAGPAKLHILYRVI